MIANDVFELAVEIAIGTLEAQHEVTLALQILPVEGATIDIRTRESDLDVGVGRKRSSGYSGRCINV